MHNVHLITFHTPKNYGAVLQGFSLMKFIESMDVNVDVIDFNSEHLRKLYPLIRKPVGIRSSIATLSALPFYFQKKRKYKTFEKFVESNFKLTKRYESIEDLCSEKWENEIFVTGSDQVFNPRRIEEERRAFYLDFIPEKAKALSYAASFGIKVVPDDKTAEIKGYLKKFDALSVRENSGIKIINDLTGKAAIKVIDPVFLNDEEFWQKYKKDTIANKDKYLLYYSLRKNKAADKFVKKIAKMKNLKIVVLTDRAISFKADYAFRDKSPEEFLSLIANAEFVVTDSFHGVAFSVIFKKQFVFCEEDPIVADRGMDLLTTLGLESIAHSPSYKGEVIDYHTVYKKLNEEIKKSKEYLEKSILSSSCEK